MNTNLLKKFAQNARRKLIDQVSSRLEYVINTDSAELREKSSQIRKLREEINATSKEQVVEKVAYTWFNRLMALRFMDANDYQPLGMRVVTPRDGYSIPEILNEAKKGHIDQELPVKSQHVYDLLDGKIPSSNPQNEAYKELLIGACNYLNKIFPFLFERLSDYSELLLPEDITSEFSIVYNLKEGMTSEDCQEVEIIGWLYQFYISEKKDEVFSSNCKVKKEDIPAATQLFTPRWIVEYMVQNTIGKLWLQNKPQSNLREHMSYFIETESLKIDEFLKVDSVEDITLLDQACGSGHILVYAFELLTKIYEEEGYNSSEIPQLIIEKNLFGFEIDQRAAQLAGFALMMKARSYQRRLFRKEVKTNILCFEDFQLNDAEIEESFEYLGIKPSDELRFDLNNLRQASNLGSLMNPNSKESELLNINKYINQRKMSSSAFLERSLNQIERSIQQLNCLATKYHCIVDNPPYMGSKKMDIPLKNWLKTNYPQSHQDLYACFIVSVKNQLLENGLASLITLQGWMFVSTFTPLREWLLKNYTFDSLVQIGGNSFPSLNSQIARAVSFSIRNKSNLHLETISFDLDSLPNSHGLDKKVLFESYLLDNKFVKRNYREFMEVNRFTFLHSIQDQLLQVFVKSTPFEDIAKPKTGLQTGSNERFVRFWYEVSWNRTYWSNLVHNKWHPYNKGGDYKKWFGNNDNVVNWENNGYEIKNFKDQNGKLRSRPQNENYYFKEGITYSLIGNADFCARYYGNGYLFDVGGSGFFPETKDKKFLLGLVNSKVGSYILSKLNPTVNFQVGDIGSIPVIPFESSSYDIDQLVDENIEISKKESELSEDNPNFISNELLNINGNGELEETTDLCIQKRLHLLNKLNRNEVQLNCWFASLYQVTESTLSDEKKINLFGNWKIKNEIHIESVQEVWSLNIITAFISYAVHCMFGRYSLDKEGLILANQGETLEDYSTKVGKSPDEITFLPDKESIIPILADEWFEDDIAGRFNEFLKVTFGKANFEKNLAFVEECLGKDVRKYFSKEFYSDHIKRYKKRPIYWMFGTPSGSFSVLIYMHRYTPDLLNDILNDYLKEYQEKLRTRIEYLDHLIETGSASEQTKAAKEKDELNLVLLELQEYEREVLYPLATERIEIDLDDGVLVNYNKFGNTIKQVSGLNDKKTKEKVRKFDWIDTSEIR